MSATPLPHVGIMPVIAVQPYGRGRTLALASDTTVDWGRDFESRWGVGDNRYFRRFWRNVVRWLTENSAAGNRRLQVETDRVIYRPGQPIEIAAIALDETLRETTAYELTAQLLAHEPPASGQLAIALQPAPDGKRYQGQLDTARLFAASRANSAELTGLLTRTLEITARHQGQELARTTVDVQLLHDSAELRELRARPETLEQLASAAGGQVLRAPEELAQLLRALPKEQGEVIVTRSPVWDHPLLWTLIFVLLCSEWILRRITAGRANLARS